MIKVLVVGAGGLTGKLLVDHLYNKYSQDDIEFILAGTHERIFKNRHILKISNELFKDVRIVLLNTPNHVSRQIVEIILDKFNNIKYIIDTSSEFRTQDKLIVVDVNNNDYDIRRNRIIASPNCIVLGCALPLKVIDSLFDIKEVVMSTYQAISGAGYNALKKFYSEQDSLIKNNDNLNKNGLVHNLWLSIDKINPNNGISYEEDKISKELGILLNKDIKTFNVTAVRVPIPYVHTVSIFIKTKNNIILDKLINRFNEYPNLLYKDLASPLDVYNQDKIYITRLRKINDNELNCIIMSDNLIQGCVLNTVALFNKCYQVVK